MKINSAEMRFIRPKAGYTLIDKKRNRVIRSKLKNSVAFSPQANYTDRATATCRRS
jgi:hypothetical protein